MGGTAQEEHGKSVRKLHAKRCEQRERKRWHSRLLEHSQTAIDELMEHFERELKTALQPVVTEECAHVADVEKSHAVATLLNVRMRNILKNVRVVKNKQYAFVTWSPEYEQPTEVKTAWGKR
jgi:hypothetical protein